MKSWACAARAASSIASVVVVGRPCDVVRNRVVEEHRLLRDDADLLAERLQGDVADVDAVDEDRATGDVVERGSRLTSVVFPARSDRRAR
jgi:hypothetical protein